MSGPGRGCLSVAWLRAVVPFAGFICAAVAWGAPPADLVFVNGAVYTVDAARSWASAVVVTGDRIIYVGDDATARGFVGHNTRVIDLNHRMLLPGFQDSHVHPGMVPNPATSLAASTSFQHARSWILGRYWSGAPTGPSPECRRWTASGPR